VRVFVSHAGRDRAWAEWVAWQLEHAGWDITVELDCWDWQARDNFVAKMTTALDTCEHMLALFSQAYFEPARDQEPGLVLRLLERRGPLLSGPPVRIDDTPAPALLGPLIAPALHGRPREQARSELLGALRPAGRPDSEPPLPGLVGDDGGAGRGCRGCCRRSGGRCRARTRRSPAATGCWCGYGTGCRGRAGR